MKKTRKISSLLLFGVVLFLIYYLPGVILAFLLVPDTDYTAPTRDYSYQIEQYGVDINVSQNKVLNITETITVTFNDSSSHGIYRYIPLSSQSSYYDDDGSLQSKRYRNTISNFTYLNSKSSQNMYYIDHSAYGPYMVYRFGNSSQYAMANEKYTFCFSYDYDIGDDRISSKDLFYFNIIGTGWDTTIGKLDFNITFPTTITSQNFTFYVGQYGQNNTGSDSRLSYTTLDKTISGTCTNIDYAEAVTIYSAFEQGYFSTAKNYTLDIILLVLTLLVVGLIILFYFKNRKTEPIIDVVEFSAPQGLTPTQVGYLDDGKVTSDELTALVVYWASKGYVKLKQNDKSVDITKLKDLPDDAKEHEKIFFNGLFKGKETINSKKLSNIDSSVGYESKKAVENELENCFKSSVKNKFNLLCAGVILLFFSLFIKNSYQALDYHLQFVLFIGVTLMIILTSYAIKNQTKKSRAKRLFILSSCSILLLSIMLAFAFSLDAYCDVFGARFYLIIVPFLLIFTYSRLEFYTKQGREYLGHIRGLKNFIQVAEKDRMEALVKDNPELFYDILPYAYVLGVSDVYMDKFKDVSISPPSWYETDVFTAYLFSQIMFDNFKIMSHTIQQLAFAHSSIKAGKTIASISHHISGGGFSGGGSGGGGGGRW